MMKLNPNIRHRDDDQEPRLELRAFDQQYVRFKGTVCNISSPHKGVKHACLFNLRVAALNNDVPFNSADITTVKHCWVDVSECGHMKHRIYQKVQGVAKVVKYVRKDGSEAYGLKLDDKHTTESEFLDDLFMLLDRIRNYPDASTEARAQCVEMTLDTISKRAESNDLVLFKYTPQTLRKEIARYKPELMCTGGVFTTLNRAGRRLQKRLDRKPVRISRAPSAKGMGF